MHGTRLLWRLYASYLFIILIAVAATGWSSSVIVKDLYMMRATEDLKAKAVLVAKIVERRLSDQDAVAVNTHLKEAAFTLPDTRLTVILPSGTVLGDSEYDTARLDNFSYRPEVKEALGGKIGISHRDSFVSNLKMIYVAIPVIKDGKLIGVVRACRPDTDMNRTLRSTYLRILAAGLCIALVGALVSLYFSHRITRPIFHLRKGAARFAEGDLKYRLDSSRSDEIGALAEAMNSMAAQLDERISTITKQRNEVEAILANMVEAVLVLDAQERIVSLNKAAEELFRITLSKVGGRSVHEVIRNTELHRFVAEAFGATGPIEGELTFIGDPDRVLQASGVAFRNVQGKNVGVLVVLNDVSRLKRLETMRRDFVTNVSHELRTPITTITGFLETLREGAIDDPKNARRFLDIIIRHANRLDMIVQDLLSLSRLEEEEEHGEIHLEESTLHTVMESVIKACAKHAEQKEIALHLDCPEDLVAKINTTLLEQAIFNLVDNAIKYSEPGKSVDLEAKKRDHEVVIRVADQGCGIEKEHLERIFERFYRVDKARSRKEGGTGLGLSIVKHIVNAHNGRVQVDSSPGVGSTFSIHLPQEGI
jgi:two-component system phosphate regulon sensor histidine kinase PhoR